VLVYPILDSLIAKGQLIHFVTPGVFIVHLLLVHQLPPSCKILCSLSYRKQATFFFLVRRFLGLAAKGARIQSSAQIISILNIAIDIGDLHLLSFDAAFD
jgi:hypothetical protein